MNRKIKSIIACALALAMTWVLAAELVPVQAYAVEQWQIDALKSERNAITAKRKERQAAVDELKAEQATYTEQLNAMNERNELTLQQIQLNEDEIALYDGMIQDKSKELDKAIELEEEQLRRYRTRVRAMEENGTYDYLAIILNTDSLSQLLTTIDDIGEIMESDRKLEDEYIAARENTQAVKAEYEAYKADIEAKQEVLRAEQLELQKDIEETAEIIAKLEEELKEREAAVEEVEAAERAANAQIDRLVAELEKQRQAEAARNAANGISVGTGYATCTGSFGWPVPSCTYLTSRFGRRVHPVYGTVRNHTGIDIGAQSGVDIIAADGGSVALAGVKGGYGNCVMIDHGNGYVTLYGHMSSIAVSTGQIINKGDVIGYVGSTGVSTGPHCHFEVLKNGGRIDPEQFYSGLTYSADCGV